MRQRQRGQRVRSFVGLLYLATLLAVIGAIAGCSDSAVKRVKVLNADLAAALNRATITTISFTQEEILSVSEQQTILPRLADASILSDQITACTNAVNASDTLQGCVAPLLTALNEDIDAASVGIKSETARASFSATLSGIVRLVNAIAEVK